MSRQVLTSEEFFKIAERPKRDVPFPEAGNGAVLPVWGMTPTERTQQEKWFRTTTKPNTPEREAATDAYRETVVARCVRNDDGSFVFTEEQIKQLGESHGGLVERLFNVAAELSGITDEDAEEAVKNLEQTQPDD